jgi:hypothetical protein
MTDWSVPNWGDQWEPEVEVPLLRELANLVEAQWPHIRCRPDFTTVGSAFVEFLVKDLVIGRACVSALDPTAPLFSCYLGAAEDEFHGSNMAAAASVIGHYSSALPEA